MKSFITLTPTGEETLNFANPDAVRLLNKALLATEYNIQHWSIPQQQLCPPIPSRADYIHHMADLMGQPVKAKLLDIGTGSNGIYTLIAASEYNWNCVGVDINQASLANLDTIIRQNENLRHRIELRHQQDKHSYFRNIVKDNEMFDVSVCNPPFHASAEDAAKANRRKNKKIGIQEPQVNFGGIDSELWCKGGEALFLKKMVKESALFAYQIRWFTSLVSQQNNVTPLLKQIQKAGATDTHIIEMKHGQKKTRIIAWTFQ